MNLGNLNDCVITDNADGTKKFFRNFGNRRTVTIYRAIIDYKTGIIEALPEKNYSEIFTFNVGGSDE